MHMAPGADAPPAAKRARLSAATFGEAALNGDEWLAKSEEDVQRWLRSDDLAVCRETTVLEGLIRWAKHDFGARRDAFVSILNSEICVRLSRFTLDELKALVEKPPIPEIANAFSRRVCEELLRRTEAGGAPPAPMRLYAQHAFEFPTQCVRNGPAGAVPDLNADSFSRYVPKPAFLMTVSASKIVVGDDGGRWTERRSSIKIYNSSTLQLEREFAIGGGRVSALASHGDKIIIGVSGGYGFCNNEDEKIAGYATGCLYVLDYEHGGAFSLDAHGSVYRHEEGGGANVLVRDPNWSVDRLFMHGDSLVSMGYGTQPDHIAESSMTSSRHLEQRQVKMWDTATWLCTCSAEGPFPGDGHTGAELCLSVGKYVVSVSAPRHGGPAWYGELHVWATPSWRQTHVIKVVGDGHIVGPVAVANSNGYLVTAYGGAIDSTVKLWDLESATCLTSFQAAHPVSSLLAGDGKLLLFYEPGP